MNNDFGNKMGIEKSRFNMLIGAFIIILTSIVCHWNIFNRELSGIHVWRQSQTELNVLNFARHDFNILNPRHNSLNEGNNILRYEFPLMQWLIAAEYKIFGESIFITRISIFIIGLFSLLGFYRLLGYNYNHKTVGFWGTWAFSFSPVFYYYTMNPLPDNFALCNSIWFLAYFFKYLRTGKIRDIVWAALFLSLATLAKLPFIIFGVVIAGFIFFRWIENIKTHWAKTLKISLIFLIFLTPAALWYLWVMPTWQGNGVLKGIFDNKISLNHALNILTYHAKTMFPKILLNWFAVPLFFIGLFYSVRTGIFRKEKFILWLLLSLTVVAYFLLELNMIDIVHDYYMMPFLPPLFMVVGFGILKLWENSYWTRFCTILILLAMPYGAYKAVQNYWNIDMSGFNNDIFLHRDDLRKAAPADAICIILNDHSNYIFAYQIDKQGHIFKGDNLPSAWVEDIIKRFGATYMYSDSRKVDENPEISKYFDNLVMERGSVRVFKLKKI